MVEEVSWKDRYGLQTRVELCRCEGFPGWERSRDQEKTWGRSNRTAWSTLQSLAMTRSWCLVGQALAQFSGCFVLFCNNMLSTGWLRSSPQAFLISPRLEVQHQGMGGFQVCLLQTVVSPCCVFTWWKGQGGSLGCLYKGTNSLHKGSVVLTLSSSHRPCLLIPSL